MDNSVLIHDLQQGREEGLTAAYRLYNRSLMYFAMQYVKTREAAEEIVADTFIKVWKLRTRFESLDKLRAFLYISTKNACLNHLRTPGTSVVLDPIEEAEYLLSEDTDAFTRMVRTELLKTIFEEASMLPAKQRDVFNLTYLEDLTAEEISEKLNMSTAAVYINRSRAVAALRNSLRLKDSLYLLALLHPFLA
ncbi:RNA polymerase sigma factor [Parapedobacter sp. DT-150]|uniref:RNA polymerase sigma factor n=1 Tax=Parapedobacter sp. DT-150 TaxID=3396162 RepID=UPI003F1D16F7